MVCPDCEANALGITARLHHAFIDSMNASNNPQLSMKLPLQPMIKKH